MNHQQPLHRPSLRRIPGLSRKLLRMFLKYQFPKKKDPKVRADLPLALKRIHQKLESFVEVLKLHLKH